MAHPFVSNSNILHRSFARQPDRVVSASGLSLFLESGREILDASAGPAVSCLGFGRPEIAEVVANQMNQLPYLYSGARFTCDVTEELESMLLQGQPGGLSKAIFHERGMTQKHHVIARKQSYHGNTIGALCVSGHKSRRAMYGHWLSHNVSFVDPCFAYRLKGNESDQDYVKRLADQLEAEILRIGPENVSAFVAETVSGTTLGCLPAVPGYFKAVREICDRHDVLLILDEIMCGKALGGGFVPLSGVLLRNKIFDALADGSQGLAHGHTLQADPVVCAAALEAQRIIRDEDLLTNAREMGKVLERLLRTNLGHMEYVGDIRGRGLFWAVEFVQDRGTKTPFPADMRLCHQIVDKALDLGLNILGNLGETGDIHVDHAIMSPPYVVTESELGRMVGILRESIQTVMSEVIDIQGA
ncbi:hypothetical protein FPRO05_13843 [Fusarium proliferatum]|uniref:Aminotransferase n=1 Tax=Gibberella intermedia TaxID=948311 RepID=A0A365MX05_GIBIN|nr:hypothetical protein FPRO05_13843 [Fusarium proliferatum]